MKNAISRSLTFPLLVLCISCSPEIEEMPKEDIQNDAVNKRGPIHTNQKIFNGGSDGYPTYRIPSIVKTTNGTLLAFAEGRGWNNEDTDNS